MAGDINNKIVLVLEYDGTNYCGFQFQDGVPTIQMELEKAILKLTGETVRVIAASRTDAGVHARGQVISFRTRSNLAVEKYVAGLNFYLPRDVAARAAYRVADSFNVRSDATSREYKYYILNSLNRSPLQRCYSYQVKEPLDILAMDSVAKMLEGRHDLLAFATELESDEMSGTVRDVYRAGVVKEGDLVVFNIEANAFLRHQVRNTVGALIGVGTGRMSGEEFKNMLGAREPGLAGPTVPACGLFLEKVNYPLGSFQEKVSENVQH
jgi:tRNA pseudouridine38-40 synthase